ncbi:MAG: adenylate/guanylate cyclase domain-containing protein [Bacteroidota bacterium]
MTLDKFKSQLFLFAQFILVWIIATFFFSFLRNYGVEERFNQSPVRDLDPSQGLSVNFVVGIVAGITYGILELLFDRPYFQKNSYGRIILGKILLSLISVKVIMAIALTLIGTFKGVYLTHEAYVETLTSKTYWVLAVYFIFIAGLISFVRMVSNKFGPGILWKMFIGKYRNPREEQRIFMFLDLKSSTTIAEKLGHVKFSNLIQDCFADLTPVIIDHKVEVYQYVGDEAVLCWPVEAGMENNNCIHCFFDYKKELASKAAYYQREYGLTPFFKAGVHMGKVIVAEVGLIKREIAYHGDVLNTAARIQSRCNHFNQPLIVSETLFKQLRPDPDITSQELGEELLRGKEKGVNIYGISKV